MFNVLILVNNPYLKEADNIIRKRISKLTFLILCFYLGGEMLINFILVACA